VTNVPVSVMVTNSVLTNENQVALPTQNPNSSFRLKYP
jgi:hypothetical protein